jgi:hypothetical protein
MIGLPGDELQDYLQLMASVIGLPGNESQD